MPLKISAAFVFLPVISSLFD